MRSSELIEALQAEVIQLEDSAKEIEMLLRQSRGESETLGRRDVQVANRLRQIESNLANYTREEIKDIYTSTRDSQMRLFMIRSQVEQLENRKALLDQYRGQLQHFIGALESKHAPDGPTRETFATPDALSPQQTIVRIIDAQETERQKLARQMHDGPATALSNLVLQAEVVERLFAQDPERARQEMAALKSAATGTFQSIRDFIFDLRPMMLDDLGIFPTLRRWVQEFQNKTQVTTNLTIMGQDRRLPHHVEVVLFRVMQELLSNAHRHGNASRIDIGIDVAEAYVSATVVDDGAGFDVQPVLADARERKTIGIGGIIERVEMLGGELHFESAVGRGTRVGLKIPAL